MADDDPTTTPGSPSREQVSSGLASAAAPAAALAFAFLVLRIFAVSGYDWETAFAVSTTIGLDDGLALLFGSLMAGHLLVAILLIFVLPLLIAAYLWGPRGHRPVVVLSVTVGLVMLVALTVSFLSWWLPLATAVLFGAFALIHRLPAEQAVRRVTTAAMVRAGAITGVAALVCAAFIQTPWVPREQIDTTDGVIYGYVLSVDSGYLNVLTDDHEFLILISSEVLSRT